MEKFGKQALQEILKKTLNIVKFMKILLPAFIAMCNIAFAQQHIISLGLLKHDVDVMGTNKEHGKDINIEYAYDFGKPNGFLYNIGRVQNITKSNFTDVTYTGVGYKKIFLEKAFFEFDWGLAHHSNKNNGSCYGNIVSREAISLGYKIHKKVSASIYFDHISDAKTCNHKSLDNAGARVSYYI